MNLYSQESGAITNIAFLSLFMVGVFHTILGATLPAMRITFQMDMGQAGYLAAAAWIGFTTAVFFGGSLSDAFTRITILTYAYIITGIGAVCIGLWRNALVNIFWIGLIGAGTGIIVSSSSALIIDRYHHRHGMMNIHHFFYAVGAIGGPLVMGYIIQRTWNWRLVYWVSGFFMLVLAGFSFMQKEELIKIPITADRSPLNLLKKKKLILLTMICVFSIGTQNSIFFWLVSYLKEVSFLSISQANLGFSLLSIGIAIGRLLFGFMARKIGNTKILLLLLILLNIILLLFNRFPVDQWELPLCFIAGVALSAIFPCLLEIGGMIFPDQKGAALGALGTAAGIGSCIISWSIAIISDFTSLRLAFIVTNLTAAVALFLISVTFKQLQCTEKSFYEKLI